jgi:hypothetical protein
MRSIRSDSSDTSIWIILLEVVLIVAGVLLGLAANAWREGQQEAARAQAALRTIRTEVAYNLSQVDSSLVAYHRQMDDALRVLRDRALAGERIEAQAFQRALPNGFRTPLLSNTAWATAQRTGAVNHLDFELVATLARLYDVQAFLQDKLDHVGTNFYVAGNVTLDDFGATATAFKLLVNDIVIQEERLRTRHYPETLTRIDDHLDRPAPALDTIGEGG